MDAQVLNAFTDLNLSGPPDRKRAVLSLPRQLEPAPEPPAATRERDRSDLLAEIKKKIKAGYYGSREVVEDLSDSFAKAFNQL